MHRLYYTQMPQCTLSGEHEIRLSKCRLHPLNELFLRSVGNVAHSSSFTAFNCITSLRGVRQVGWNVPPRFSAFMTDHDSHVLNNTIPEFNVACLIFGVAFSRGANSQDTHWITTMNAIMMSYETISSTPAM